jgi:hypothetical protein
MQDGAVGPDGLRSTVLPPRRAEQHQGSFPSLKVHGECAASAAADDHVGLVLVELGLGDCEGGGEVVVRKSGVDDGVAVVFQVGRFDAARNGLPAVKKENEH